MTHYTPHLFSVLVLLTSACSSDSASPDEPGPTPDTQPLTANSCADIQSLLAKGQLKPGKRLTGANGFSFEAFEPASEAFVETCRELEASVESVIDAGVAGATADYWTPELRVTVSRGYADKVAERPMDANGLFRTASTAKSYVGALASLMAIEGRLDLDNSDGQHALANYLPEVADKIEYADRITVRQLLNHTSGIPDYFGDTGPDWLEHDLEAHARGEMVTEDEALELIYGRKANFEPGTSASYCNTGYVLASRIMSNIAGRAYQDEFRERFMEPVDLEETYFEKHDSFDLARLAHGYRDASEIGQNFDDWFDVDQGYGFANGGVVATARDTGKFFRSIVGGDSPLPDVDFDRFLETLRPKSGELYGIGVLQDGSCIGHDGNFTGYSTRAMHCLDTDSTFVMFSSSTVPEHEALVDAITKQWTTARGG